MAGAVEAPQMTMTKTNEEGDNVCNVVKPSGLLKSPYAINTPYQHILPSRLIITQQ